ncbi:putative two-component system response regulator [Azospirillum lipoferum]|uniref:Response regulator n=1 Tax=Azospirillum lipoferum TaxID=193 RepID=A0A5A9GT87_AZOLI|nr:MULTISPECIES: HD domain-containing phosphohydrolase [Azospirillum]KAA0596549.1 response regulator [Azospirillum lipoferum]MCP1610552.1 putative two-component system response regulator [Azospirillum lipoferum]MDW5538005.1 response regulator [Azospirillum sp. NL1]
MNILIVDDDRTNLLIMAAIVRRMDDAEPVTMSNPLDAVEWLRGNEPDLILLDQMMPEMDGIDLLRRIRDDARLDTVPVVMITANTAVDIRVRALDEGCSDFLTKPVVVPEVQARLRNLLALRQSRALLRDRAALLAAEVERVTAALQRQGKELVSRLSRAAEYRDPETGAHIERMALYSRLIAEVAGCGGAFAWELMKAAPMHDIGKIGIPDMILLKPGRLTPEEMTVMRQHATIGHRILADSDIPLLRLASEIAVSHHEKFDGSGYPNRLSGTAIPLSGRIVAIADVFDALTSTRPYKRSWTLEEARAFMVENSGRHFDPSLLDAFLSRWDEVCRIHRENADELPEFTPEEA